MQADNITCAASIGAGVIGYSWALKFAMAGLEVWAQNRTEESSALARERVHASMESLVKNGVYDDAQAAQIEARIHYTTSVAEAVAHAQFIQESSSEHYEVKWELVRELEAAAAPDAIIASSTSGLLVTEIAKNAEHPERFCGGHPYNPPHLIPLVEITKGEKTADATVECAKAFYARCGEGQRTDRGFLTVLAEGPRLHLQPPPDGPVPRGRQPRPVGRVHRGGRRQGRHLRPGHPLGHHGPVARL